MYNVQLVAQYIIKFCNQHSIPVSNLKLQKLLYFIQAEFLVRKGVPCFHEDFEAWDFGPVSPQVYRKYKIYGSSNIPYSGVLLSGRIAPEDKEIINGIITTCSKYSASQLVEITHRQTPWIEAYAPYESNTITKHSIKKFFTKK